MATISEALALNYSLAKREHPSLRKGQFMQQAFPNRYKNEDSAYQAYNQTLKGRRPGRRLVPLTQPDRTKVVRGKRVTIGSAREGLWKVIVHFNYVDQDGNLVEDQEISFNMQSSEHTDLLAVPYLESAMVPIAEEKLVEYTQQSFGNAQLTYIEIIPINTYQQQAVDIDNLNI